MVLLIKNNNILFIKVNKNILKLFQNTEIIILENKFCIKFVLLNK